MNSPAYTMLFYLCFKPTNILQWFIFYYLGNNIRSTVVRTQNKRWSIIPRINKLIIVYNNGILKVFEINIPIMITPNTSNIAISNILKLCRPEFGFPKIYLYLHKPNMRLYYIHTFFFIWVYTLKKSYKNIPIIIFSNVCLYY